MKKYLLGAVIVILLMAGVLSFGNPQWHKYIYLFQVSMLHDNAGSAVATSGSFEIVLGPLDIPRDFSGTWRHWYSNGNIGSSVDFVNGKVHGKGFLYHIDGHLIYEVNYEDNELHGEAFHFYPNRFVKIHRNYDKQHGFLGDWFEYASNGRLLEHVRYELAPNGLETKSTLIQTYDSYENTITYWVGEEFDFIQTKIIDGKEEVVVDSKRGINRRQEFGLGTKKQRVFEKVSSH